MSTPTRAGRSSRGIYWEQRGSGPDLTLVIGFGQDCSAWSLVAHELEPHFTLTLIDNRGAGRSPNLDERLTLDALADDVLHVLGELGVERTAIAGQSMGGGIAQLVTLARPDLISKVALINSFAALPATPRLAFEAVYGLLIHGASLEDVLANLSPWIYSGSFLQVPGTFEQLVAAAAETPFPQPIHSYRAQLDAIVAFDSSSRLADITQPTLVLGGAEDLVATAATTRKLADGIPDSTLATLNTGHASHIEAPDDVAKSVTSFLLD